MSDGIRAQPVADVQIGRTRRIAASIVAVERDHSLAVLLQGIEVCLRDIRRGKAQPALTLGGAEVQCLLELIVEIGLAPLVSHTLSVVLTDGATSQEDCCQQAKEYIHVLHCRRSCS